MRCRCICAVGVVLVGIINVGKLNLGKIVRLRVGDD